MLLPPCPSAAACPSSSLYASCSALGHSLPVAACNYVASDVAIAKAATGTSTRFDVHLVALAPEPSCPCPCPCRLPLPGPAALPLASPRLALPRLPLPRLLQRTRLTCKQSAHCDGAEAVYAVSCTATHTHTDIVYLCVCEPVCAHIITMLFHEY